MLYIFWNIFAFIITTGILVVIHELGHFTAARICNVTIQRFSIGFGYVLCRFQDKKNTEYVISAIPLGGYVKMLNKDDIKTNHNNTGKKNQGTFEDKTIWQRSLIVIAGPVFNIIFSFLIYWLIFMIGTTTHRPIIFDIIPNSIVSKNHIPRNVEIYAIDGVQTPNWESVQLKLIDVLNKKNKNITIHTTPVHSSKITKHFIDLTDWKYETSTQNIITSLGIIPIHTHIIKPIISKIQKNSAGMKSGLKTGDEIISINNKMITTWEMFEQEIKNNPNKILKLSVKRKNKILLLEIKTKHHINNNNIEEFIGISPTYLPVAKKYTVTQQFGLIESIQKSSEKVFNLISITLNMLYKLAIGDIKLNNLGGPLFIAQTAKKTAENGLIPYLTFLSLISINLGIVNLFPLPILDGGHLLLLIIEMLAGKTISKKIEKYTYHFGMILLMLLMCLSIFNDLSRL